MFASKVAIYNDNKLVGTTRRPRSRISTPTHPLYRQIARARAHPARPRPRCAAARQVVRAASRRSPACSLSRASILRAAAKCWCCSTRRPSRSTQNVAVETSLAALHALAGQLPADASAPGQRPGHASAARLCGVRCSLTRRRPRLPSPPQAALVARRRHLPDLSAQLRRFERRRHRRSARASPRSSTMSPRSASTAIWLSPFFTSPMRDFGYDVADYCGVDPVFGTLADFDALVERAHALGLKVIIDQVYSHSSDQHPWFQESRSSRDNPKADWYVWADAKPDGSPPNNWQSVFGGPAWTWDARRGQYYLHNFLSEQPDLNVHNRRGAGRAARRRALLARPRRRRLPASTRSTSRCTTRSCATIRRRRTAASARGRSTSSSISTTSRTRTSSSFLERLRAADRQLRRPLHARRGRRRSRADAK